MQVGKVSEITYNRSIVKKITNKTEGIFSGIDASEMQLEDVTVVMSSNCILKWYQGCEEYTLQKTINALWEKGATPRYVQLEINVPEVFEEKKLGKIIQNLNECILRKQLTICQCKAYKSEVDVPIVHITVLGETSYRFSGKNLRPGMELVMAGSIAIGGTAVIADLFEDKLQKKFTQSFVRNCKELKDYIDVTNIVKVALEKEGDIVALHSVSESGTFGAVWEFASSAGLGVDIDISRIPVWQETIEVAELFGYHPYLIDGTGSVLFATKNGVELVSRFHEKGISADIIGKFTDGKDRVARKGDEKRYLEPPRGDELYNFL